MAKNPACLRSVLMVAAVMGCSGLGTVPAAAAEQVTVSQNGPGIVITRAVPYGDLDLSRAGDREMLRSRVNRVAVQICRDVYDASPGIQSFTSFHEPCVTNAKQDALAQVPGTPFPSAYRLPREFG